MNTPDKVVHLKVAEVEVAGGCTTFPVVFPSCFPLRLRNKCHLHPQLSTVLRSILDLCCHFDLLMFVIVTVFDHLFFMHKKYQN